MTGVAHVSTTHMHDPAAQKQQAGTPGELPCLESGDEAREELLHRARRLPDSCRRRLPCHRSRVARAGGAAGLEQR